MAAASLLGCSVAWAVVPETGLYWNPMFPGTSTFIEHQDGTVFAVMYAYGADGEPEFYIAAGELLLGGTLEPTPWTEGLFPLNGLVAPLFRVTGGRVLNDVRPYSPEVSYQSERIGMLQLTFAFHGSVGSIVELDNPGASQISLREDVLVRFNFAYGAFGFSQFTPNGTCWPDLRGEWVVVDQSDPARPAWRFNFTEAVPIAAQFGCSTYPNTVTFRDPSRAAELRCANRNGEPEPGTGRRLIPGCELWLDGEILFSVARPDVGLRRLVGSVGPLSESGSGILRRPQRVLGVRAD